MNRQDSLRPVTRRALRINYVSAGICMPPLPPSSGSSSGSGVLLDFVTTTRLPGPALTVSDYTSTSLRLEWSAIPGAVFYQIFRSTSPTGPFVFLQGPVEPTFYIDTPPAPDTYYYQVTAIEPNAGETNPSNVGVGVIPFLFPPVAGYKVWVAPESDKFSDVAGTIPATDDGEIRYWEDLSGNGNHLKFNAGNTSSSGGPSNGPDLLNGQRAVVFGDAPYIAAPNQNRTALVTDNIGTLIPAGGVTAFVVSAFRDPSVGTAEAEGICFNLREARIALAQDVTDKRWVTYRRGLPATPCVDPVVVGTAFNIMALRFDSVAQEMILYRGGVAVDSQTDASANFSGRVGIGFHTVLGDNRHFSGSVAEMIVYPYALTDDEVALVHEYLTQKHNL